jgi:hypothetical protein
MCFSEVGDERNENKHQKKNLTKNPIETETLIEILQIQVFYSVVTVVISCD